MLRSQLHLTSSKMLIRPTAKPASEESRVPSDDPPMTGEILDCFHTRYRCHRTDQYTVPVPVRRYVLDIGLLLLWVRIVVIVVRGCFPLHALHA